MPQESVPRRRLSPGPAESGPSQQRAGGTGSQHCGPSPAGLVGRRSVGLRPRSSPALLSPSCACAHAKHPAPRDRHAPRTAACTPPPGKALHRGERHGARGGSAEQFSRRLIARRGGERVYVPRPRLDRGAPWEDPRAQRCPACATRRGSRAMPGPGGRRARASHRAGTRLREAASGKP